MKRGRCQCSGAQAGAALTHPSSRPLPSYANTRLVFEQDPDFLFQYRGASSTNKTTKSGPSLNPITNTL